MSKPHHLQPASTTLKPLYKQTTRTMLKLLNTTTHRDTVYCFSPYWTNHKSNGKKQQIARERSNPLYTSQQTAGTASKALRNCQCTAKLQRVVGFLVMLVNSIILNTKRIFYTLKLWKRISKVVVFFCLIKKYIP